PEDKTSWEIFHDALAAAILDWRRRWVEQQLRRRADRKALVIGGAALAALALLAFAFWAVRQSSERNQERRERKLALSGELALQSAQTLPDDPELALRLALFADQTASTPQAAAALRQAVLGFHRHLTVPADSESAQTAAFSPDGRRIVTGGDGGIARVW